MSNRAQRFGASRRGCGNPREPGCDPQGAHMAAAIYARVSWADVEVRLVGLVGRKSYA